MKPSIGRTVHYVDPVTGKHQAAVVSALNARESEAQAEMVSLSILAENSFGLAKDVAHDEETHREGTWHFPEREQETP